MRKNVRIDDGNCRTADKYKLANFHLITRHGKVYGPRADGRPAAANPPLSPSPSPRPSPFLPPSLRRAASARRQ